MDRKLLFFAVGILFAVHAVESRATDFEKSPLVWAEQAKTPEINAVWADFQKRHILDPSVSAESGYLSWTRANWNNFLKGRITDYGSKSVNSFMVGVKSTILADFKTGHSRGIRHNGSGISGNPQNLYWGVTRFKTYVLRLAAAKDYDVYNCPNQYILGAIDSRIEPVHFQTQRVNHVLSGALPLDLSGCTLVR